MSVEQSETVIEDFDNDDRIRVMYRHSVPADGKWHDVPDLPIRHIASRTPELVEVWMLHSYPDDGRGPAGVTEPTVPMRVYGTGERIFEPRAKHVGTCLAAEGRLVWHLFAYDPTA